MYSGLSLWCVALDDKLPEHSQMKVVYAERPGSTNHKIGVTKISRQVLRTQLKRSQATPFYDAEITRSGQRDQEAKANPSAKKKASISFTLRSQDGSWRLNSPSRKVRPTISGDPTMNATSEADEDTFAQSQYDSVS